MKKTELLGIQLPKWPRLLVKGDLVTKEQAMEIIIRTDGFGFSSNDGEFNKRLNEIVFDVKVAPHSIYSAIESQKGFTTWNETNEYIKSKRDAVGSLDLCYLSNSQISSCWIGGTHGWCNWDGTINTSSYNIGKWPETQEVFDEWCLIAKASPFLNLRAQLIDYQEAYVSEVNPEMNSKEVLIPLVEFVVKDGKVKIKEVEELLMPITEFNISEQWLKGLFEREKGCTVEQFQTAFNFVKEKLTK